MSDKLNFKYLVEKIENAERFSFDEGVALFNDATLPELKVAANFMREKKVRNKVCFIENKHLYYSNVCAWRCSFCVFSKKKSDAHAYTKNPDELVREIDATPFITEVRITGGVNPKLGIDYFCSIIFKIKEKYPHIHVEALAPTEIDFIANLDKISPKEALVKLKEAGLGSLAAGGAEIANERVRKILCPNKSPFSTWLDISRIAHELGIMSNASILYGHIETVEERVEHILKIRELQDETKGYNAFIPLKYIENKNSDIKSSIQDASEDLRMYAISRLLLDNIKHIKALWLFNDTDMMRSLLDFGVDDIGGTVYENNKGVARSAGSKANACFSKKDMLQLISSAGREPFERGILYERKKT